MHVIGERNALSRWSAGRFVLVTDRQICSETFRNFDRGAMLMGTTSIPGYDDEYPFKYGSTKVCLFGLWDVK